MLIHLGVGLTKQDITDITLQCLVVNSSVISSKLVILLKSLLLVPVCWMKLDSTMMNLDV
jgi:hypothetical protein